MLDHFLHHAHRDAQALKRGGGRELISLDALEAENRLALEPADERSPETQRLDCFKQSSLERLRLWAHH